jgi:hypothetical protein
MFCPPHHLFAGTLVILELVSVGESNPTILPNSAGGREHPDDWVSLLVAEG